MAQLQTDIAVIGAGPQALTLVTHVLQKKAKLRDRIQVLDPSGSWMTQWQQQFAAQEIAELRSPAVHHPDPNAHALRAFAEGRYHELHPPYDRPGTCLFQEFCDTVVQRWQLQNHVVTAAVTRLEPWSKQPSQFRLTLSTGDTVLARRVVLATGGGQPYLPDWAKQISATHPPERLCHASQVRLSTLSSLAGETVLIVGSGLTSGHLAVGAVKRGANVVMMARRTFQEKLFDAEPGWLGPKYLKGFHAEPDMQTRWQLVQQARNGGSLTPAMMTRLRQLQRQGHITFYEHCQVADAHWQGDTWKVCCDNHMAHNRIAHHPIHRVWLATGTTLDIRSHSLLADVWKQYPIETINGLPVLDEHLRWPGCELFLMGPWTALRVGPVARNLFGGKLACDRIVPALTKATLSFSGNASRNQSAMPFEGIHRSTSLAKAGRQDSI
ncbi:FAD/NAD(P)-binding protein [Oscillatoria sp. CS-180]|uniref:FAD/NAD(P)-binding protein n=1 Tax=Oscillatoria sp. CS-180 TaxID=3021720 RepID=UPI00232BC767|nr:FAD/NAD(P)-binding protein [Oscillatoria sp. CS-180]MDB9526302.1 FAD/NAD(P)-binding protein [Oscillatoria sp. CS-180]